MRKLELQNQIKSSTTAYLLFLFLFCTHYAYMGKWGLQILFWVTGGGLLIWMFIDLFRIGGMVQRHNNVIYAQIEAIEKQEKLDTIAMIHAAKS